MYWYLWSMYECMNESSRCSWLEIISPNVRIVFFSLLAKFFILALFFKMVPYQLFKHNLNFEPRKWVSLWRACLKSLPGFTGSAWFSGAPKAEWFLFSVGDDTGGWSGAVAFWDFSAKEPPAVSLLCPVVLGWAVAVWVTFFWSRLTEVRKSSC